MGIGKPFGSYHKGAKKNTRKRKCNIPSFDNKPSQVRSHSDSHTDRVLEDNRNLIAALAQLDSRSMATFIENTAGPNPRGVILTVHGGTPSHRGSESVSFPIGGGHCGDGFPRGGIIVDVAPMHHSQPQPQPQPKPQPSVKLAQGEELVGYIIKKPNGEMVLRFK